MTFTNTDCVEVRARFGRQMQVNVSWQVCGHFDDYVRFKLHDQIFPIEYKITQEIRK
jgi:hypothetical protein